jgi:tetratricopeptide (TPR) repeat protein
VGMAFTSLAAFQPPPTDTRVLPALSLDNVPAAVRPDLERAYRHAQAHPDDATAVGKLGMMLHAYDQHRAAEICYRTARALAQESLPWAYLLGRVQAELADHRGAIDSLRAALKIDSTYLPARAWLADVLMAKGDLGKSRAEYTALARDFPELAIAHYGLGRLEAMAGNVKPAVSHYQRAIEIAPQFGGAHYALALAYRDNGRDDLAESHLQAFRRWGARRPLPPDPLFAKVQSLRATARDLLEEGARLGRSGKIEESISLHLKAIEADPTAAQAHVNLISLYGQLDRSEQAELHYRAALALQSSLADAHYNFGVLLASAGRDREAAGVFRQALEVNPFHAQAHHNLATLLAAEGNLKDAASHYRQAVANDPAHRGARFNLGRTLLALGHPRDATEHFERLLEPQSPEAARFTYALASAWLAAGEIAKAREYASRALREARAHGQTELATRIEHDLQKMTAKRP